MNGWPCGWDVVKAQVGTSPSWHEYVMIWNDAASILMMFVLSASMEITCTVEDLGGIFQGLTKYNLKLAQKEAHVGAKETKFLGHHISVD